MEEQSEVTNESATSQQHPELHQHLLAIALEENGHFSVAQQNESILAVAQELALAGDELTRRFSKNDTKPDTIWQNVKLYAFSATFRLIFGLV